LAYASKPSKKLDGISLEDILVRVSSETVVFKVGNSLAVRLVGDCRLPRGTRVRERWEGKTIVIEPVVDKWSPDFLASAGTWDEPLERPGRNEQARDPFA
jgi:virulence-associated protein VagC